MFKSCQFKYAIKIKQIFIQMKKIDKLKSFNVWKSEVNRVLSNDEIQIKYIIYDH